MSFMNTPSGFPIPPSFSFLPQNPNFFPSHLHHHPPSSTTTVTTTSPDLSTALSTLNDLIQLSQTTLHYISTLLPTISSTTTLCPCPFNPHHRLPAESIFRHSLQCPSSPSPIPLALLDSLQYAKTLQSSHQLIKQNLFIQTIQDPNADLWFSLDDYSDFGSNFFYQDCPGVVTINQHSTNRMLTLPGVLSMESANFTCSVGTDVKSFSRECIMLLPSEVWVAKTEIEAWNDYPTWYSYSVLRSILCLNTSKWCGFLRWVILNSASYGVVIDVPMREHIVLLFRLCLRAITREAVGYVKSLSFSSLVKDLTMSFKCPVLVQALTWLGSQLSVLYGEVNGKSFSINMFKQCLLSSLFLVVKKALESPSLKEVDGKLEEPLEESMDNGKKSLASESIDNSMIFVSQIAAAVAALHERSLLEEKIKALRDTRPLTTYQRMAEHANISKRAVEERQKRVNYRPLLEHDGLLWQRSRCQETNKMKTREELLAEERDYKRRRMSYRGKKLKRSTTQVMRGIIEEYMEEIMQAGGLDCLAKGAAEAETLASEPVSVHGSSTDADELKKSAPESSEVSRECPHGLGKQLHSHNNTRSTKFEDEYPEDNRQHKRDFYWHDGHLEAHGRIDRDIHGRDYYSRSPDGTKASSCSREQISNRGRRDDAILSRKYFPQSSDRSHSWSHESNSHLRERVDYKPEVNDKKQRNTYRNRRSDSVTRHEFDDRYDPSESRDMYEDQFNSGCKYAGPDQLHSN